MKSILLFLLLLSVSKTQAQNDTIYYNKKWGVCNALDAQYYRLIVKENNLFKVKDCYLNGIVQMKGVYSSLNPDVKEGLFNINCKLLAHMIFISLFICTAIYRK